MEILYVLIIRIFCRITQAAIDEDDQVNFIRYMYIFIKLQLVKRPFFVIYYTIMGIYIQNHILLRIESIFL